jgi:DNA-binding NarL/FixJ family response regulator
MIQIVLIELQELVRIGLATALTKQMPKAEIVGHAATGEKGLALIKAKSPAIVVLDLDLPQKNGLETIQFLKLHYPKIKVMVLTANREPEIVLSAFDAGVDSYCLQHHSISLITTALQQTYQGNHWIDPAIAHYLIQRRNPPSSQSSDLAVQLFDESWQMIEHLTTREVDVLELMAKGLTNKEIATQLYIGNGTVKSHVASLMQKFGARSRTEAASRALDCGVLNQYRRNSA